MAIPDEMDQLYATILDSYPHDARHRDLVIPRFQHRLNVCTQWALPRHSRLLDIGCGQGDSTLILATEISSTGHVTGIDTAPPNYGSPYTVAQSQAHILASRPLGSRITFIHDDPLRILRDPEYHGQFDGAVFCHSLWYFASESVVRDLFLTLAEAGVRNIYLAEWTGEAVDPSQIPHRLGAEAQMLLHSSRAEAKSPRLMDQNVRSALLPEELLKLADNTKWRLVRRGVVQTPQNMPDGRREAQFVQSSFFRKSVLCEKLDKDLENKLLGRCEEVVEVTKKVEQTYGRVRCMDVMWAVLERNN